VQLDRVGGELVVAEVREVVAQREVLLDDPGAERGGGHRRLDADRMVGVADDAAQLGGERADRREVRPLDGDRVGRHAVQHGDRVGRGARSLQACLRRTHVGHLRQARGEQHRRAGSPHGVEQGQEVVVPRRHLKGVDERR
jgi:hypothetical protein